MEISTRQAFVLRRVVEGYLESGQPVGSKWVADQDDVPWGPSTVRAELARLEELGLLGHPHTSAGRVPTDAGYRLYADDLVAESGELPVPRRLGLELARDELEDAMRETTAQLSQVTDLLALVTAPPLGTTTVRHVDVLLLQPQVAMVVVITSTGGVTKRVFSYERPLDQGLVDWAAAYLNEQLRGMGLGRRMLHLRLEDPSLGSPERDFLRTLAPAFTQLEETAEQTLFVDGAARLLSEQRIQEVSQLEQLMAMLEQRVALLGLLRGALSEQSVYLRIGRELGAEPLRSLSMVAANYGVPARNLGTVSVIGPLRMDYATAIDTVREAAAELSRLVADVYDR